MEAYRKIVIEVLDNGKVKHNRTGIDTIAIAGAMFEHDMSEGFPLLTTKFVPFHLVASELEFFIKGITDKKWLQERNNHIWDEFSFVDGRSLTRSKEEKEIYQLKSNDLGVLYGYQWIKFNSNAYEPLPNANIPYKKIKNPSADLFESKYYGKFYVLAENKKTVDIQFKDTGYCKTISKSQFNSKLIKDPYFKKYYDVACIGLPDTSNAYHKKIKLIWTNMISRCYNQNAKDFDMYGGRGVRICNDWLVYEYFLEDVCKLSNWELKLKEWDNYSLDKDILGNGKFYSLKTCKWASSKEQTENKISSILFDAISPEGKSIKNITNLKLFCRKNKIDPGDANKRLNGKYKWKPGGWDFINKRKNTFIKNKGINQLKKLIMTLKTNPDDRRMIVSAWNPQQLDQMALPPCHYAFQVTVIDGEVNLMWNQRSVDVALGLPFNIASYGLLLELLAKESGFKPGKLIGFLGDVHIYKNHIKGLEEQLERVPFIPPRLEFSKFTSIFDWEYTDCNIAEYCHHPGIKFDIAV